MCSVTLLMEDRRLGRILLPIPLCLVHAGTPTGACKKFPRNHLLPCWLVGRLGVDTDFQGRHYGSIPRTDAMGRT